MQLSTKNSATSEKIVLSAAQLFARQGYHGTSTRDIARLAGVSENTLFRHFDRKEDLFWSALRWHSSALKMRRDLVEGIAQGQAPEVVLPKILEMMADLVSYRPELLRLIAVAFVELEWKAEAFCQDHLAQDLSAINHYLKRNMKSGRIRELDPTMLTAALMTTALMHPGISKLIEGNNPAYSNSQEAGRAQARFWLELLTPKAAPYPWPNLEKSGERSGSATS
jgi:AcrR family transcriptional regulator